VHGKGGVMGGAELVRKSAETVAEVARFGGHILTTCDEIPPDLAAVRMPVRRTLKVAAARLFPPSPVPRGSRHLEGQAR
jgi:hypothetical protein